MTGARSSIALALLAALLATAVAGAQSEWSAPRDTIRLPALLQQATISDPRQRQFQLSSAATALRIQNIDTDRKPSIALSGQAQYQSSVTTIAVPAPVRTLNIVFPTPPYDTYDAHLNAQQPLITPSVAPRRVAERAQLAETQAELRVTLFGLRQEVNDAFFTAALLQEQLSALTATLDDLDARLREMNTRVREGAALPAEAAAIEAAVLQQRHGAGRLASGSTCGAGQAFDADRPRHRSGRDDRAARGGRHHVAGARGAPA